MKRLPFLIILLAAVSLLPSCDVQNDASVIPPQIDRFDVVEGDYDFITLTQTVDTTNLVLPISIVINVDTGDKKNTVAVYYGEKDEWYSSDFDPNSAHLGTIIGKCRNRVVAFSGFKKGGICYVIVDDMYKENFVIE